jgi:FHA domain
MSLKSDKLAKRISEIQQFVNARIGRDNTYSEVSQELAKIAESLATQKLVFQIVSNNSALAQAFVNFISTSETLTDACLLQTAPLPKRPTHSSSKLSAKLLCEEVTSISSSLSESGKIVVGRDPSQCQINIPNDRSLVSGRHFEIEPVVDSVTQWQIRDLSRHGTYLNGQRLQGCQILQTGDRITLGEATLTYKSIQFIFDCSFEIERQDDGFDGQLLDCDIFYLLVNSEQELSEDEKWLLQKATQAEIAQIAILLEIPTADKEIAKEVENKATAIETLLKSQYPGISFEIATLFLQPFFANSESQEIEDPFQKQLDKLIKSLESLVKRKPEDILAQRLTVRIQSQLTQIEQILETQKTAFLQGIQQAETQTQELGKDELKEQMKKALKDADAERDKFFRRVKTELNQSKAALLDEFSRSSLLTQIKEFVKSLQPVPTFSGGFCELKFQLARKVETDSVALAAVSLCRSELERWSTNQWEGICHHYGKGGLQGLLKIIHKRLDCISSMQLSNSLFSSSQSINLQSVLQNSLIVEEIETKYKQPSLIGYLFKNLRGQMISGLGILMLVAGQFINDKKIVVAILLPVFIIITFLAYQADKANKLEEEIEKLKEKIARHYELLTKKIVDNLIEKINLKLEDKERQIKEILETVDEQYKIHLTELDKKQLEIKGSIEQSKLQHKNLEKEIAELLKLKQIG